MLHAAFQIWGCHIWACGERASGSDECVKSETVGIKNSGNLSLSQYVLFAEPTECNNMNKIRLRMI